MAIRLAISLVACSPLCQLCENSLSLLLFAAEASFVAVPLTPSGEKREGYSLCGNFEESSHFGGSHSLGSVPIMMAEVTIPRGGSFSMFVFLCNFGRCFHFHPVPPSSLATSAGSTVRRCRSVNIIVLYTQHHSYHPFHFLYARLAT